MHVDGRCHCGAISFEAEVDPAQVSVCHCTDCQMLTGSAFRANVPATAASFVLRGPAPVAYVKTADSGARRRHAFCGACGTPIYACADVDRPDRYSLRVGTIAQRAALARPKQQIFRRSALGWVDELAAVPQFSTGAT